MNLIPDRWTSPTTTLSSGHVFTIQKKAPAELPGKDVFPFISNKKKVIFQLATLVCWRVTPCETGFALLFGSFGENSQVRFNASDKEPAKCLSVQSFELQPAKELVGAESGGFLGFLNDYLGIMLTDFCLGCSWFW